MFDSAAYVFQKEIVEKIHISLLSLVTGRIIHKLERLLAEFEENECFSVISCVEIVQLNSDLLNN